MKSIFGGKTAVAFAACHRMDFNVVSIDVIIVLVLLIVIGSIVCVIVFLMLFILLETFAILVKHLRRLLIWVGILIRVLGSRWVLGRARLT